MTPYFRFNAPSGCVASSNDPVEASSDPYRIAVSVGRISRLRLVDRFVSPSSSPIWVRKPATPRDTGDHTSASSLPKIVRTIWNPHRWGSPGRRSGYRRLLNGIAISAVQPSATSLAAESKRASHERSPVGGAPSDAASAALMPPRPLPGVRPPPPPGRPPPPPPPDMRWALDSSRESACTP